MQTGGHLSPVVAPLASLTTAVTMATKIHPDFVRCAVVSPVAVETFGAAHLKRQRGRCLQFGQLSLLVKQEGPPQLEEQQSARQVDAAAVTWKQW